MLIFLASKGKLACAISELLIHLMKWQAKLYYYIEFWSKLILFKINDLIFIRFEQCTIS